MKIVKVVFDIHAKLFEKPFDYLYLDKNDYHIKDNFYLYNYVENLNILKNMVQLPQVKINEICVGCIALVPFGYSMRCAYVVEVVDIDAENFDFAKNVYKPVIYVLSNSLFDNSKLSLAGFISNKYFAYYSACIKLFLPPGMHIKSKKINQKWNVDINFPTIPKKIFIGKGKNFDSYKIKKNAIKQKKIIDSINTNDLSLECLKNKFGNINSSLKVLLENNVVTKYEHIDNYLDKFDMLNHTDYLLTDEQTNVISKISSCIDQKKDDVFVLNGVTGSGKTEVYIQLIKKVLKNKLKAIVLIPEISLTYQTVSRFVNSLGNTIAVLHSKMSKSQRFLQWQNIKNNKANVVIGARSALFSPIDNIGIIIIDEEHENTYKQSNAPRYHARDCALFLSKQNRCPLVLGSATPSLESIYNCKYDNWHLLKLTKRTNNKPLPKIEIVDMANEFNQGCKSIFSHKLSKAIVQEIKLGNKVVLLHNRRGFSSYVFCRKCGFKPQCPNCSTSLTYHSKLKVDTIVDGKETKLYKEMLLCHHCGHLEYPFNVCPSCGSPYIARYGAGTQNVEQQLNSLLISNHCSNVNIVRMDADTTRVKDGHEKCLKQFMQPGAAILLGTQMIAKGLDINEVTLVGIVLIDTNLSFPDFRCSEKTFNLILQVAGRAGRSNLTGKVIIQTYCPDEPCIKYAGNYQIKEFLTQELNNRKLLTYPPYFSLTNCIFNGYDEKLTKECADNFYDSLLLFLNNLKFSDYELLKAVPCPLSKINNKYRYHILCKYKKDDKFHEIMHQFLKKFTINDNVELKIDIDAYNLM